MKKILAGLLFITTALSAQETKVSPLVVSGYLEAYYNYNFTHPKDNTTAPFLYSYNRNNEVNLNLAFVKAAYTTERVRANAAFAAGTYMNANYASETGVLKNLYEANIGLRLSEKANLWLDAGVLPSHIGWESAIGRDNPNLNRSLAAENSPYFETGARLSYTTKSERWYLSLLVLNGWQRIQRTAGNSTPAFGTQVTFKASSSITLNSSTFIGSDQPDSLRKMRYFHDLYATLQFSDHWAAVAGFDIGAQQQSKGSAKFNTWSTAAVILRYLPSTKLNLALRGEYYQDKHGVIIASGKNNGIDTWGYSVNADYHILNNLLCRLEARTINGYQTTLTTALAFSF